MKFQLAKKTNIKNQSTHLVEGTISQKVGKNSNKSLCIIYEIRVSKSNTTLDSTKTRNNNEKETIEINTFAYLLDHLIQNSK